MCQRIKEKKLFFFFGRQKRKMMTKKKTGASAYPPPTTFFLATFWFEAKNELGETDEGCHKKYEFYVGNWKHTSGVTYQ